MAADTVGHTPPLPQVNAQAAKPSRKAPCTTSWTSCCRWADPYAKRNGRDLDGPARRINGLSRAADQTNLTSTTSQDLEPPGVVTSTVSPTCLPISARASGECTDMRPDLMSASWAPTMV